MRKYDLDAARDERDDALARVTRRHFMDTALEVVATLPPGEYTGEDVRRRVMDTGLEPHHPNAWGALIRTALIRKLLFETGKITHATDTRSHACRTSVYSR